MLFDIQLNKKKLLEFRLMQLLKMYKKTRLQKKVGNTRTNQDDNDTIEEKM